MKKTMPPAEWYFDLDPVTEGTDVSCSFTVNQIKQIQLDAFREGMWKAAEICLQHNNSGEGANCHSAILEFAAEVKIKNL